MEKILTCSEYHHYDLKPETKPLNCLDADELEYLYTQIDADLDVAARLLFPQQPEDHLAATEKIAQWAINKKAVIESNAVNKPHIALVFDKLCHRLWQQLPDYARCIKIRID